MKIFIKTYGCSFNSSDSEIMAGLINESKEHSIVNSIDEADLIIVNSCTVKEKAENKLWRDIREINKPIIVAGCVPQAEQDKTKFKEMPVVGTYNVDKIVEVIDNYSKGDVVQLFNKKELVRVNIPKKRINPIVEIVPINEGCLGKCDYCKTKFARGYLKSYPIKDIVKHIRDSLNNGAKEIWLTSQDTACFGYDINTNIVNLLKEILRINREFKIRLGMGNPDFLPDYLDELIEVFKDPRIYKFLHIPIQSGSNNVLKAMKRNYTVESFKKIILEFKKVHPMVTIASDIIVGYPNETNSDFEKTIELLNKIKPDVLNISRFWYRPGTLAMKKKKLPTLTVKNRGIKITKVFHKLALEVNKKWLKWEGDVLITEKGIKNTWIGRNYAYRPVILKGDFKLGNLINVKITKTTNIDLRGIRRGARNGA
ncbi:tRNA (N(6)-L-threonylcarbamoyladenosine(37)-C(2))-methylthiotransferase [archaeon]|jgi:threonylcarbamoyladenosine tRNA methylthiotransferase CDKAL1|nr:tRNA (N(6)-L-threonylcarbamoyladenosine(37)-C(2))-methylthiotransferase [archaeon]MBT4022036.1 tRNA (N(6)-L-threonylcarbamoyladenosine(37)-C(2))-methylthiotransferase [archaeon]MBT4272649.1 tRNA (N(6)-L-threonylcarbamoyladenosine(37)-C(2))-methylthiotransferase [archaeon]MBT4461447.1 tRNA (N(6)-L-threonylcarbamoyladenosine(37)-C(2))-methylthiotransferase [archaeon]MBT4857783.1 tRNA (N(6)-L-threonylcarbamoyladenosine(37)-C(2))-methylthiotransferase [archaeon]